MQQFNFWFCIRVQGEGHIPNSVCRESSLRCSAYTYEIWDSINAQIIVKFSRTPNAWHCFLEGKTKWQLKQQQGTTCKLALSAPNTFEKLPSRACYVLSVTEPDVKRSFLSLSTRKVSGPDGVPGHVIKTCMDQQAAVFADMCDLSVVLSNSAFKLLTANSGGG